MLNAHCLQLLKDDHGDALTIDAFYPSTRTRIPQFCNSPYCVHRGAPCFAPSAELYRQMNSGSPAERKADRQRCLALLSVGGSDEPMKLRQRAGMDLDSGAQPACNRAASAGPASRSAHDRLRAMSTSPPAAAALAPSPRALAALLFVALLFASNHIFARLAFDQGLDVATAVAVRSGLTAVVVALLVQRMGLGWRMSPRHKRTMPLIGLLVAGQSLCLYAAVARLPVALALLAFNLFPLCAALAAFLIYRDRPPRAVLLAMPVILTGLVLALDVTGATSGLDLAGQWQRIGTGVLLALGAAALFGIVLALTQHAVADLDGRVRTAQTMGLVALAAMVAVALQGGPHFPARPTGWLALLALTACYGTALTVVFTLLPRLGVVGNSPILNVEPVIAATLAWAVLGQPMALSQWLGALLVVGAVMALGLRRR